MEDDNALIPNHHSVLTHPVEVQKSISCRKYQALIAHALSFGKEISSVLKDWMWHDPLEINRHRMFKNFLYTRGCNSSYSILIFLGYFLLA